MDNILKIEYRKKLLLIAVLATLIVSLLAFYAFEHYVNGWTMEDDFGNEIGNVNQ